MAERRKRRTKGPEQPLVPTHEWLTARLMSMAAQDNPTGIQAIKALRETLPKGDRPLDLLGGAPKVVNELKTSRPRAPRVYKQGTNPRPEIGDGHEDEATVNAVAAAMLNGDPFDDDGSEDE